MKKAIYFMLAAALFMPVACQKSSNNDNPKTDDVVMADPATKQAAKVVEFKDAPALIIKKNGNSEEKIVKKVEFTESNRAIVHATPVLAAKADEIEEILIFSYTVNGSTYTISGVGTFTVSSNTVDIKAEGGETVTVSAQVTNTSTSNSTTSNLARNWAVADVFISVKGGNVSAEKKFNGVDLYEIATYVNGQGVNFTEAQLNAFKGYKVEEFIFTGSNTFVINFTQANPYYGSWTLSGNNFSYKLTYGGDDFFNGEASGTISFPAQNKAELKINGKIDANGSSYTGTLEMNLSAR